MLESLLAFAAVSAVVICTPGQDTALTIRNTLGGGRRSGVATAGGVALGQAIWTLAASAGVVAILSASEPAFRALSSPARRISSTSAASRSTRGFAVAATARASEATRQSTLRAHSARA